jgi:hypothetical protein
MPTLAEIRARYPNAAGYSDGELIDFVSKSAGMSVPETTKFLGIRTGNESDLWTDLKIGVQKVPGAVTGALDTGAAIYGIGRPFDKMSDDLGRRTGFQPEKWAKDNELRYSDNRLKSNQEIDQAWENGSAMDVAGAYASNPRAALGTVVRSLPSTVVGGVGARGLRAAGLALPAAAGVGEGAVIAGSTMNDMSEGVDDERAALASLGAGVAGGAIGYAGGRLAARMGLGDVDVLSSGTSTKSLPRRVGAGALQEGLLEEAPQSAVEQGFQNYAEGNDITQGMGRAAVEGAIAGGLMGGAFNVRRQRAPISDIDQTDLLQDTPEDFGQPTNAPIDVNPGEGLSPVELIERNVGINGEGRKRSDVKAGFNEKLETPVVILDRQGNPKVTDSAFELYEFENRVPDGPSKLASLGYGGFNGEGYEPRNPTEPTKPATGLEYGGYNGEGYSPAGGTPARTPQSAMSMLGYGGYNGEGYEPRGFTPPSEPAPVAPAATSLDADGRMTFDFVKNIAALDKLHGSTTKWIRTNLVGKPPEAIEALRGANLSDNQFKIVEALDGYFNQGAPNGNDQVQEVRQEPMLLQEGQGGQQGQEATNAPVQAQVKRGPVFDNEVDFRDWAFDRLSLPEPMRRAYMMSAVGVEYGEDGNYEITMAPKSYDRVAKMLGVSKKTVQDWVETVGKQMDTLRLKHLGAKAMPEEDADELAPGEMVAESELEPERATEIQTSDDALFDEDNAGDVDEREDEGSNLNISSSKDAGGEVNANNDSAAERNYRKVIESAKGDGRYEEAVKAWDSANRALPDGVKAVSFDKLGPGQQAWFIDAFDDNPGEANAAISDMVQDGVKFSQSERVSEVQADGKKIVAPRLNLRAYPKALRQIAYLSAVGYDAALSNLKAIYVLPESSTMDGAVMKNPDGTYNLYLNEVFLGEYSEGATQNLERIITHELSHVLDDVDGDRIYSMSSYLADGGSVTTELTTKFNQNSWVKKNFNYPLNPVYKTEGDELPIELFAQIMSAYYHPVLRAGLMANAPQAYNFAKDIADDLRQQTPETESVRGSSPAQTAAAGESIAASRTERQAVREQVPAGAKEELGFKKWFDGSKIVDKQGKPLVVYHGTQADFDSFQPGAFNNGLFFSPSPDTASKYAGEREGANVMPVYLSMKRPRLVEKADYDAAALRQAKAAGYDGVVVRDGTKVDIIVAFDPKQVKSASGNNGDFDGNDSRITASRSARPEVKRTMSKVGYAMKNLAPKLLTDSQLVEQFGDVLASLKQHVTLKNEMAALQSQLTQDAHKVMERWGTFAFKNKAANERLMSLMNEATRLGVHPDLAFDAELNAHLTLAQRADHARLKGLYDALPADAKTIYQDAKGILANNWQLRKEIYADVVTSAYAVRIAEAQKANDEKRATKLTRDRDRAIEEHARNIKQLKGPYFPLMRFGDYIAVAESDALRDLRAEMEEAEGDKYRELAEKVAAMEKDSKQYVVEAFESRTDMEERAAGLKAKGFNVTEKLAEQYSQEMRPVTAGAIDRISDALSSQFDSRTANRLKDLVTEMYISALPEHHALQRQIRRKGVAGASPNMLRSFAEAVERDSFYLSRMKYNKDLTSNLFAMKKEAGKVGVDAQEIYNNVIARTEADYKYEQTPIISFIARASSIFHLGIAPSFLLTNMTQPWFITTPQLAGTHGMTKTFSAMRKSWADSVNILKQGKGGELFNLADVDFSTVRDPNERAMLQRLMDLNKLDATQVLDMGMVANGSDPRTMKAIRAFNWATHHIELVNRVSTALATYRLERLRNPALTEEQLINKAAAMIDSTQLDYSNENAAYFMKSGVGLGKFNKLVFQFRKYQQGMLYLLFRNAQQAIKGDKEAGRALAYLMGTQLMFAGAVGIPLTAPLIGAAALMFGGGDDDEKGDLETQLRNYMADTIGADAARVLWKGLPNALGVDLSMNVGMSGLLKPFPMMSSRDLTQARTGEDAVKELLFNAAGAPVGMAANLWDGAKLAMEGDLYRGLARMSPKFIGSLIKAAEMGEKGVTTRAGNQVMAPDQFDAWDLAFKAAGFNPTSVSEHYAAQTSKENVSRAITARRGALLKDFALAKLQGDDVTNVLEEIDAFNAEHPTNRIKASDRIKAVQSRKKISSDADETGVVFRKSEKNLRGINRFAEGS